MITSDGKHCTIPGVVVWDGITRPETNDSGKLKHSCKIVIHPQIPEFADAWNLANQELINGEFKGQLPPGGRFAISDVMAGEFNDMFAGFKCMNAGTYNGAPQVFDINGQELNAQTYGQMLYPGAKVELLVNFYSYNNKAKGVTAGLSGIRIVDATTPRLNIGGGINAASVFGQAAPAGMPQQAPAIDPNAALATHQAVAPAVGAPLAAQVVPVAGAVPGSTIQPAPAQYLQPQ